MAFGNTTVIEDLPFDVHAGKTFGFLGSNGSGEDHDPAGVVGDLSAHHRDPAHQRQDLRTGRRETAGCLPEERGLYKK